MSDSIEYFGDESKGSQNLWRYTSLAKLINILHPEGNEQLVAYRSSKLNDDYEGTLSERVKEEIERSLIADYLAESYPELESTRQKYPDNAGEEFVEYVAKSDAKTMANQIHEMFEEMREITYANCWSCKEYEDSNMWRAYTSGSDGVVIKTTFDRMRRSITEYDGVLYFGSVNYIDFDDEDMERDAIAPFFYKRHHFRNESEFRLIVTDYDRQYFDLNTGVEGIPEPSGNNKRYIEIDADELIQEIRVHPESSDYFREVVKTAVGRADIPVKESELRTSLN